MTDTPSEELRGDVRRVINNYPTMTIATVLGVLELVKAELLDRLRRMPDKEEGR